MDADEFAQITDGLSGLLELGQAAIQKTAEFHQTAVDAGLPAEVAATLSAEFGLNLMRMMSLGGSK